MAKKATRSYAVGYGKPPRNTRFQKGQSGNPRGRPKSSKTAQASLMKALAEQVEVTDKGRTRRISKHDLSMLQLVNKAAKGDQRAIELVMKLLPPCEAERADPDHPAFAAGSSRAEVVFYIPDNGRSVVPPAYRGVDGSIDNLAKRIEKNNEVLAMLGPEEKQQFLCSLAKVVRELGQIRA